MRDMHKFLYKNFFTKLDPVDYDYAAQDTMKHLYFKDYKELKNVDWDIDNEPLSSKILSVIGLIIGYVSILTIAYFIGV